MQKPQELSSSPSFIISFQLRIIAVQVLGLQHAACGENSSPKRRCGIWRPVFGAGNMQMRRSWGKRQSCQLG